MLATNHTLAPLGHIATLGHLDTVVHPCSLPFLPSHTADLELPALLKKQLLDDHDAIHEDSKLVPLPRKPSAGEVLDAYLESTAERRAAAGGGSGGTLEGVRRGQAGREGQGGAARGC